MVRARPRKSDADASGASEASAWLRVAEEAGRLGVWEWDLSTNRTVWSRGMERLFGLAPGTHDGRVESLIQRIHPADRKRAQDLAAESLRHGKGPPHVDFRIVRPDGNVRWIASRTFRDRRGRPRRVTGVNIDITEQVQARQQLEQADARLRVALRAEGLVVFHQDRQLRYTWIANPALGVSASDVVGRTDLQLMGRHGRELTQIKRRVLRSGRGERRTVWAQLGSAGRWYDLVVEPSRDAEGRVTGLLSCASDVTARVRAQSELEASRTRLRDLVDHQRDALEAERAAVARDVHDHVGALLTGVRLKLAALAARQADEATPGSLQRIAAALDLAQEATRRICAHLMPVELEDLGLAGSCRAYATEWGRTTGIRVLGRFGPLRNEPLAVVATDAFRAMQELLTNVARHARASRVRISLSSRDGTLALRVTDDGRGLPRRPRTQGFGLEGLRERVARHGGRFDLRSAATGVDARIEIPLRRPA